MTRALVSPAGPGRILDVDIAGDGAVDTPVYVPLSSDRPYYRVRVTGAATVEPFRYVRKADGTEETVSLAGAAGPTTIGPSEEAGIEFDYPVQASFLTITDTSHSANHAIVDAGESH